MRFLLTIGLLSLLTSPVSASDGRWAHRLNQLNRYWGTGWSDGYHACRHPTRSFRADLPPTPHWLQQRWTHPPALHGIAGSPDAAAAIGGAPHPVPPYPQQAPPYPRRAPGYPPELQSPRAPSTPPVPPSVLEEIREYEREMDRSDVSGSLDEGTAFLDFLRAVHRSDNYVAELDAP